METSLKAGVGVFAPMKALSSCPGELENWSLTVEVDCNSCLPVLTCQLDGPLTLQQGGVKPTARGAEILSLCLRYYHAMILLVWPT